MTVTLDDHPDVTPLIVLIEVLITLTNDHCKNYGLNLTQWIGPAEKEIIIGQYNFYIFEDAFTDWEIDTAIEFGLGADKVQNLCGPREYFIEQNGVIVPFAHVVQQDEIDTTNFHFERTFGANDAILVVDTSDESLAGV